MALIAQLGEHCTGIAEVVGSNPAQSLNFFPGLCSSSVAAALALMIVISSQCLDIPMKHCLSFLIYYILVFPLVLVSIEKIYQTLKTVFKHISKHLKRLQKYSAARRILSSLPGVWKCAQTRSFVFHILPGYITKTIISILKTHKLHSEIYLLLTNSVAWNVSRLPPSAFPGRETPEVWAL